MSKLKKKRRQALEFKRIEKLIDKEFKRQVSRHIESFFYPIGIEKHNFLRKYSFDSMRVETLPFNTINEQLH